MSRLDRSLGRVVRWNNEQVERRSLDRYDPNPRDLADCGWNRRLEAAHPQLRAEWDAVIGSTDQLPPIEEVIAEDQGNAGTWRAGLLISRGRPATRLAERFPVATSLLGDVPGLWSALWSVLEPGARLPPHQGPNAGMLRYHLGVDCGDGAALRVGDRTTPYRDGVGILFDDTAVHEAWNDGPRPRVTLFCEILRPVGGPGRWANRAVQQLVSLDARYRAAPRRADEWDRRVAPTPSAGREPSQ